jgi:predicted dienelactone hydrolase
VRKRLVPLLKAAVATCVSTLLVTACSVGEPASPHSRFDAEVDAGIGDAESEVAASLDVSAEPDVSDIGPTLSAPDFPGPYGIGFRQIVAAYDHPLAGGRREIPVSLWYPTSDVSGSPAFYQGLVRRDEVFEDAALADTDRALPVLVFSHGNNSLPEQSFFMTEHWASHGWVVVAPEHLGNSAFDGIDDQPESFYWRPLDVRATLDALYSLSAPDPLAGRLSDEVVMSGHSFGGYTTLAIAGAGFSTDSVICDGSDRRLLVRFYCELVDAALEALLDGGFLDDRVDVAIPQTPGGALFFAGSPGDDGLASVQIPMLLMTGGLDATLPDDIEGTPIWESVIGNGQLRFHLTEAGHFTYSNMCVLLPAIAEDDGCGEGFIAPGRALSMINTYSLAFARWSLWADEPSRVLLFETPAPSELVLSER